MSAINLVWVSCLLLFAGCHPRSHLLEPELSYVPQQRQFRDMASDFPPLTTEESSQEWAKEYRIGILFSRDFDFYRAITSYKRALFLLPASSKERRMEVEYHIVLNYYLGRKYQEALETFECGTLRTATGAFPAFRDLLIVLYDSYLETGQSEKAEAVLLLLDKGDPEAARDLQLFTTLSAGALAEAACQSKGTPLEEGVSHFAGDYCRCAKSVSKAQWLNAALPGAGYLYVGQKKTALTSLILNTSFIAATYFFFDQGNWGAGLFTASLEFGWYFGGINGAGLAAKEYNEQLYNTAGKDFMIKNHLFPVLLLQTGF